MRIIIINDRSAKLFLLNNYYVSLNSAFNYSTTVHVYYTRVEATGTINFRYMELLWLPEFQGKLLINHDCVAAI